MRALKCLLLPFALSLFIASCASESTAPDESTMTNDTTLSAEAPVGAAPDETATAPATDSVLPGSGTLDPPKPPGR